MTNIQKAIEKQARMEDDPDTSPAEIYDHAIRQLRLARNVIALVHKYTEHDTLVTDLHAALQSWADHVNNES